MAHAGGSELLSRRQVHLSGDDGGDLHLSLHLHPGLRTRGRLRLRPVIPAGESDGAASARHACSGEGCHRGPRRRYLVERRPAHLPPLWRLAAGRDVAAARIPRGDVRHDLHVRAAASARVVHAGDALEQVPPGSPQLGRPGRHLALVRRRDHIARRGRRRGDRRQIPLRLARAAAVARAARLQGGPELLRDAPAAPDRRALATGGLHPLHARHHLLAALWHAHPHDGKRRVPSGRLDPRRPRGARLRGSERAVRPDAAARHGAHPFLVHPRLDVLVHGDNVHGGIR
mmetsp:Transcript_21519/g.69463  ORF Transcript_21519/g.69463 Transcript_21519/m.69463 type:complete len:287 (-) Transcript_21519:1565-2425(-)